MVIVRTKPVPFYRTENQKIRIWHYVCTSLFAIEANAIRRNKSLFGKEGGCTAVTELLGKQEVREEGHSFSRRKSVGGVL